MEQVPEMTALELEAEIMKRFKRVPSCRDIRAEYVQIMPLEPKGAGPNWIASIDLPMSVSRCWTRSPPRRRCNLTCRSPINATGSSRKGFGLAL